MRLYPRSSVWSKPKILTNFSLKSISLTLDRCYHCSYSLRCTDMAIVAGDCPSLLSATPANIPPRRPHSHTFLQRAPSEISQTDNSYHTLLEIMARNLPPCPEMNRTSRAEKFEILHTDWGDDIPERQRLPKPNPRLVASMSSCVDMASSRTSGKGNPGKMTWDALACTQTRRMDAICCSNLHVWQDKSHYYSSFLRTVLT